MSGLGRRSALGLTAALVLTQLLAPAVEAETARTVDIGLDPALELLGVVELLAGPSTKERGTASLHAEELRQTAGLFAPWRASAVRAWTAGRGGTCGFLKRSDALVRLDLTELPEFAARSAIPDDFVDCLGGPRGLSGWLDALRAFAAESSFLEHLAAKKARWEPGLDMFRKEADAADIIVKIERYTGLPFLGTYSMRLSSHHAPGAQTNSVITNEDGSTRIVSILGPRAAPGQPVIRVDEILPIAWHELAHGVLDRVGDLYREEVLRRSAAQKTLSWECYGGWEQCFKENMVRAVMIRLVTLEKGAAFGERVLQEEGVKKYPYLTALVARLKEYESDRARYPTLAHFYPQLLSVFPEAPPAPALSRRTAGAGDPGPDWLAEGAIPFSTSGQREKALALLDALLAGPGEPNLDLLLRRGVLRLSQADYEGSRQDAEAVLRARPDSPAGWYLTAMAQEGKGLRPEAAAALAKAARSCAALRAESVLCRNVNSRLSLAKEGRPRPAPAAALAISFDADPRVELLGIVQMLAEPDSFHLLLSSAPPAYAEYGRKAWKLFSPHAAHPAVSGLRQLRKENRLLETVSGLLALSAPPELAPLPYAKEGEVRIPDAKFLADLRDLSRRGGFAEFYRSHAGFFKLAVERAQEESRRGLRPQTVASYLRHLQLERHRFILTPLLPRDMAANAVVSDAGGRQNVRIRPADYTGKSLFDLGDFGASPAHEIVHNHIDSYALDHRQELEAYAGLMVAGCTDSWMGCVLEHVDLAVTLRMLALERGEGAYAATLADFTKRGFPYLEPLCRRLKEWEATSGVSFEKFYPRLVAVFRETLLKDASAQARAALERRAKEASARREPAVVPRTAADSIRDARLELASALIGLAQQREPAGPFAAYSSHAAVEKVRGILNKEELGALPAELMLYVSSPPALFPTGMIPESLLASAGGQEAVDEYYEAARDFAVRSKFSRYYESSAKTYQELARRHSQQLKSISPAAGRLVVSTLLPPRYWSRLVRIKRTAPPEVWTLMSDGLMGADGVGHPGAPVEIRMTTDPRVELMSVLLLLNRPVAAPGPLSPYQLDAAAWFSSFSTHPAVAHAAALLKRDPRTNLPAQIALRLSTPPDLYAAEPIPGGYLEAAGGEEVVDRFMDSMRDFARASRFMTFYEAHRADYAAFAAQAESETLASISPKAIAAYLGVPLSERYSFLLAPLLAEHHAANLSLRHYNRVEEVRLRPARYSKERGMKFLFDQFDSSVAHELVHTVTNPLVSDWDAKNAKGSLVCRDQQGESWSGCVQEHLVYAVTLRILALDLGEPVYRESLREYTSRGFPHLEALGTGLKEYERDRARYKTLKEFYPQLQTVFSKALAKGAPEPSESDSAPRRLKDQGVKAFLDGRFAEAVKSFTDALKLTPRDAETFLNLGVVYEKLGEGEKALESYTRAVDSSVERSARAREIKVAAFSSRAALLRSRGRVEEARQDLRRALETAPTDWDGRQDIERRLAP